MSGFLFGVGFVFCAANLLLFLILVGRTLHASKPDWEQMRDDEEQRSWLTKPDATRIRPASPDEQYAEARWERVDGTTEVRRYKAIPDGEKD